MHRFVSFRFVMILAAGCSGSSPEPDLSPILNEPAEATRGPVDPAAQEFDLGPVLARGQEIRHEFTLTNPTDRPVRLLRATAFTPCCSAVGPLPRSIPPGGTVKVPVVYRPGLQSGPRRVAFSVETDGLNRPAHWLALTARLFPEWAIIPSDENPRSFPLGSGGKFTFRIVCRARGGEGLTLPTTIEAAEPLQLAPPGATRVTEQEGGLDETDRTIEVLVPPGAAIGLNRGVLSFRWSDGRTSNHEVVWEVIPRLQAFPSVLVFKSTDVPTTASVRVVSDGRPFRILKVTGALLGDGLAIPAGSSRRHGLLLPIEPSRTTGSAQGDDITITTDHPDQPVVTVGVSLFSPGRAKGGTD